ncbi:MAG TPA: L-seryl-tRNA(Sec) selenium transferase [Actinomycetota bacterium]|nr:L-seryl-tRNA(Sec) selenium transferase [Actinomycetota bacterium]
MAETDLLRKIPQVDAVLRDDAVRGVAALLGEAAAARLVRDAIAAARAAAQKGTEPPSAAAMATEIAARATALHGSRLRRAVNATGVILHTNLGRAPLSREAIAAVADAAGPAPLEFDIAAGERGVRAPLAAFLAATLTGAEAAHVVNNNAAALLLMLAAIARDREVIVARGELIEIGGEFRLPSIMEASGAMLREVGTTNRTHPRDYRGAIGERTAAILLVHPSNYRVVGFTTQPSLPDIGAIAREAGVPLLYDIGSGLLAPDEHLPDEPDARGALDGGADLICFSGDKLLGGPQAGVLAGRKDLVAACKRHPIARAVRADKMTLAAMEATLLQIARGAPTPVASMLSADTETLRSRCESLASGLEGASVIEGQSVAGGGSVPGHGIASPVVAIACDKPERVTAALRANDPPVIARIDDGRLIVDPRTVDPSDDAALRAALERAIRS